jgi:CRP/FNR family transcriptional regulator, cyclic AMP receptor protein
MLVLNTPPAAYPGLPLPGAPINPPAIRQSPPYLLPVRLSIPTAAEFGPATDPVVRNALAVHPALGTLSEQGRRTLLRWSRIRTLKRREVICRQGDPATTVILVLEGYLKLSVSLPDGAEVFLDIAAPGECAGEMAALDRLTHDADFTALSPCRLLIIDGRQFWRAFEGRPEASMAIVRLAADRLRRTTAQVVGLGGQTAAARLAKVLLRLASLASPVPLQLSQGELGVMIGASREVVNKQLRDWRDAGWIQMTGGIVTSIEPTALALIAGDDAEQDATPCRAFA